MSYTVKTTGTKRVLSAVALATLWLAGAAGGWAAEPPTGPTYTNSLGMGFVRFEPGTFSMGTGTDLRIVDITGGPDWDEQPAHSVTLTAPFYVLTGRVTKAQFDQAGLGAADNDGHVSWDRAAAFCAWLSQRDGLTYRLPTEAEWEYVRRNPGTVTDFPGEWVNDWHGPYRNVSLTNPAGPMAGVTKVARSDATNRLSQATSKEGQYVFRVVLDTAPVNRWVHSPLPFNQMAVKQSTTSALQGPDPAKPYFTVRFALPIPPSTDGQQNGSLLGVDPAVSFYSHSPGFEIMPNGDALAVWYSSAGNEDGKLVRSVQARLRYGAEEFDMPELLFKFKGDIDGPACQWREGTTNWLFTGVTPQGGGGCAGPYVFRVSRSTDNGATWTMTLPKFLDIVGSPQPITSAFRAPDGAMYLATDETGGAGHPQSLLWRSPDNGLTWQSQKGRTYGRHTAIMPLDQTGRLLGLGGKVSDINGYMPQTLSTNWGATWESPTQSPFPMLGGNQRPSVWRLADGKLAMIGDATLIRTTTPPAGWTNGTAPYVALSSDNGATWRFKALPVASKHEGGGSLTLGYSTVRQAPNGVIHVLATMTHPGIHYEFNEAWVYSADGDIPPETSGGRIAFYSEKYPSGKPKATWNARICPNGRYLLDGVETHYYENGKKQREVTWASGRRTGEETLWAENGDKFWSWNHDLTNNVSTWTHWWSNGRKRMESQWDTNPTARDLPNRHFRGLVANGAARHWDSTGQEVKTYTFLNGKLSPGGAQAPQAGKPQQAVRPPQTGQHAQPGLAYELFGDTNLERAQGSGPATEIGPMDKGNNDWGLRFTGMLMPPADGEYAFRAEADTGVRVTIGNNLVIDGWAKDAARVGKATLSKGKPVRIVVEYSFDRGKGGTKPTLRLFWTPPGGSEVPVPVGR